LSFYVFNEWHAGSRLRVWKGGIAPVPACSATSICHGAFLFFSSALCETYEYAALHQNGELLLCHDPAVPDGGHHYLQVPVCPGLNSLYGNFYVQVAVYRGISHNLHSNILKEFG